MRRWFPRPVPCPIGGEPVLVSELRLRDREDLAAYVALVAGPLEEAFDTDSPDYPARLEAIYDDPASWPPPLGSAFADAILFDDDDGLAAFLTSACRDHPGMSAATAAELAAVISDEELAAVEAVAWGGHRDAKAEALRLIDARNGFSPFASLTAARGEPITMDQAIGEAINGLGWASPDAVGNLTMTQLSLVRTGGIPEDEGDAVPEDNDLRERVEAARRRFFGVVETRPPTEPEVVEWEEAF